MSESGTAPYEAICEASPDALLLVDSNGEITYANARVSDLFDYAPEALVGEPIEILVPERHREGHVQQRDGYIADPSTRPMGADLALSGRRKDGSTVPVDVSLSPIETGDGSAVLAAVRDRSERATLEAQYRTILEAVPDAVVVADADTGEIVEANRQVQALFGYEPAELVGRPQDTLHPSDETERYRRLFETHVGAEQAILSTLPDGSDIQVETADGERRPVEINAYVFEQDERRLITGVFRDLSTRRHHETALQRLHEASREMMGAESDEAVARIASRTATEVLDMPMNGVHLHDPVTDILEPVEWSPASEAIFGGDPPAIPADEGLAGRAFETGEAQIFADVREADALNDETPFVSELVLPLGEHGIFLVSSTEPDDFDAADEALAQVLAATVESALDRVAREETLRAKNEHLEAFASIVSHDLRNPLTVAMGRLEMAQRDCQSEHLADIERAHDRMAVLIEDLLTLAREGESVAETEVVGLADLVADCWRTVDTERATLVTETDRAVRADRSRLRQLLENLIRNAIDHGREDITVRVGALADGFFVADDGPGIPEDDRERVFEAGFSTASDGTGFGLEIVRRIAQAHGWTVSAAESTSGGARIEITGVEIVE